MLAQPPPAVRKYIRYIASIAVTVGVGLAPLLGKVHIPGFTAVLSQFPVNIAQSLIPLAAFVMSLPAIAVQLFSHGRPLRIRWVVGGFVLTVTLTLFFTISLSNAYSKMVV